MTMYTRRRVSLNMVMLIAMCVVMMQCVGTDAKMNYWTPEYDPEASLRYCHFCAATPCISNAYNHWNCTYCDIPGETRGFNITLISENTKLNTLAYVGVNGATDEIVCAWRGTQGWKNWLLDFDAKHVPFYGVPNATVEQGFMLIYDSHQEELQAEITRLAEIYPDYKIAITGHSLGAGLSTLQTAHYYLQELFAGRIVHYNFGSPRVGNLAFAERFSEIEMYRVWQHLDPVPNLPFQGLGYHHLPREVWLEKDGAAHVCDGSGEDPYCDDSAPIHYKKNWWYHTHYFCPGHVCPDAPLGCNVEPEVTCPDAPRPY